MASSTRDFRSLLYYLSQQLNQHEVDALIWIHHLPKEYKGESALTVLQLMEQFDFFSHENPEELINVLKAIKKHDLCKHVKEYTKGAKKTRKNSSTSCSSEIETVEKVLACGFLSMEDNAKQMLEKLDLMEKSVKAHNNKSIEELFSEAKEAADSLHIILRRGAGMTRSSNNLQLSRSLPTSEEQSVLRFSEDGSQGVATSPKDSAPHDSLPSRTQARPIPKRKERPVILNRCKFVRFHAHCLNEI